MKEPKKAESECRYLIIDHEDPLLEYVNIIGEEYRPATILDLERGMMHQHKVTF